MSFMNDSLSAAEHLSSVIGQLTKTQVRRVLLGLLHDVDVAAEDIRQVVEPFFLDRAALHIQEVIEEDKAQDREMEQELDAVDVLLDSYNRSADKKILSDVEVKLNDLFVILQSRAKDDHVWQSQVQQRVEKLNTIRGKNFPDPSIFNVGYQKRGWMDQRKRGFKGWKRRWFVLKGNHLTYFVKTEPTTLASSTEWGEVIREGFLRKKKQGKGWKTRWIQIRPEGLLYFKAQKDKEPIGALPFSECERVENPADKSFELTYGNVKYFFTPEHDEEFSSWSSAFSRVSPETKNDPNMSYFTIRGVIDLSSSILEDKLEKSDRTHCFSLTVEGGKTLAFAVDTERHKQEWLSLLGIIVKTDNTNFRKARNASISNGASGIMKQSSLQDMASGRTTPTLPNGMDSPGAVRFAFKDEAIGRSLAVRNENDNFEGKFQSHSEENSEDEEDEKEEAEEVAKERTKMVRRETIKLIRTFKLEVHLEDQPQLYTFAFDNSVLVDQVKTYLFKHIPALVNSNHNDYSLGVDADDLLTVEFLRFVSSNTFVEVAVRTCGIARVGLFLRDNLRKINEQRAARGRPLKNTNELTAQAEQQRSELEQKLYQEKLEREKLEKERAEMEREKVALERAASEKQLLLEKLAREREETRLEHEKSARQTEEKILVSSSTQTEDEKPEFRPMSKAHSSDKISWRNQTNNQILTSSNLAKKAISDNNNNNAVVAASSSATPGLKSPIVPVGSGNATAISGAVPEKPKTMITKTNPRSPQASVWQQVQPSVSATKRPMIIPCDGWSIEVPGEPLLASQTKSWQFAIGMDNNLSEVVEPFFYRKYFISAKKTVNFLGSDPKYGSISFSMCVSPEAYRGVLFTKLGTRQISVLPAAMKMQGPSIKSRKMQMVQYLLSKLEPNINSKNLRLSMHPDMQKELLSLEERQVCSGFKFGMVYSKGGQTNENELFNNEHGSDEWNDFLDMLGTRIALKGWSQYNAGLDVKGDTTGTHSLYTNWKGNEIMFHVSTMLPYHPDDPQKLERKRHVGNDICVIVFQEGATPYLPSTITSHFNHIVAVVHYEKGAGGYRLGFAFKDGVPAFGPILNTHGFIKKEDIKEFLLTKLINGETASLLAPVFAQKLVRTREALLNYYLQQFL